MNTTDTVYKTDRFLPRISGMLHVGLLVYLQSRRIRCFQALQQRCRCREQLRHTKSTKQKHGVQYSSARFLTRHPRNTDANSETLVVDNSTCKVNRSPNVCGHTVPKCIQLPSRGVHENGNSHENPTKIRMGIP